MRIEPSMTSSPTFDQSVALPTSEELRNQALCASWQRDRQVARRRLAWRWAWWYVARYAWAPVLAVMALAAIWHWWPEHRPTPDPANVPETTRRKLDAGPSAVNSPFSPNSDKRLHNKEP